MKCDGCVAAVHTALKSVPGVTEAAVDLTSASAKITYDKEKPSLGALIAVVKKAGFNALPI
jgi:copper chaperone